MILGAQIFKFFFLKKKRHWSKIQNPARGSNSPSQGGGVDLNFRGVIKNRNRWGLHPLTPPPLLTYAS